VEAVRVTRPALPPTLPLTHTISRQHSPFSAKPGWWELLALLATAVEVQPGTEAQVLARTARQIATTRI
jgi:hypothetical protein